MSLHHRSKTPFDGNAFLDGDRQLSEIWDLVPKKIQYIRISSQFLTLGRGVGDPLEPVQRREQCEASSTFLDSLREPLLCGCE